MILRKGGGVIAIYMIPQQWNIEISAQRIKKPSSFHTTNIMATNVIARSHAILRHAAHGSWWRHQMETCSALLALCGEFTGPGEFPAQRPVTRTFDIFFDLRVNKRLSKQSWGWWFETPSWSLWRQCNVSQNIPSSTTRMFLEVKIVESTCWASCGETTQQARYLIIM